MPDALKNIGSIDFGSFVKFSINAGNRRQINDHAIAEIFPKVKNDDQNDPSPGRIVHIDGLHAYAFEKGIEKSAIIIEEIKHDDAENDVGDEVRQKHNGLGRFFKPGTFNFAEQDGTSYRERMTQQNKCQIVSDRVHGQLQQNAGFPKKFEVFQPNERTIPEAMVKIEASKSKVDANHRDVRIYEEENERGQQHQKQDFINGQLVKKTFAFPHLLMILLFFVATGLLLS